MGIGLLVLWIPAAVGFSWREFLGSRQLKVDNLFLRGKDYRHHHHHHHHHHHYNRQRSSETHSYSALKRHHDPPEKRVANDNVDGGAPATDEVEKVPGIPTNPTTSTSDLSRHDDGDDPPERNVGNPPISTSPPTASPTEPVSTNTTTTSPPTVSPTSSTIATSPPPTVSPTNSTKSPPPTASPTSSTTATPPTASPTNSTASPPPTISPTNSTASPPPTASPTSISTTFAPVIPPSSVPSSRPSSVPSSFPSVSPTTRASSQPSSSPTIRQTTESPTLTLTESPTDTFAPTASPVEWIPFNNVLSGNTTGDDFGYSVALSGDGSCMAVGIPGQAMVRVYVDFNGEWIQPEPDIVGDLNSFFGFSVAVNQDCTIVLGGAPAIGQAIAYQVIDNGNMDIWTMLGSPIVGAVASDYTGGAVALSAQGLTAAIGSPGANDNTGQVAVYQFDNNDWVSIGNAMTGESTNDKAGISVALSSDGDTVAYGVPSNSHSGGHDAGRVIVQRWNDDEWEQLGESLDGGAGYQCGWSVDIDNDGRTVALGCPGAPGIGDGTGFIRVYTFDNEGWRARGQDIAGETAGARIGERISLSGDDGLTVAYYDGPITNDNVVDGKAIVRVFEQNSWELYGDEIVVSTDGGPKYPYDIDMTDDGSLIIIGSVGENDSGSVNTFEAIDATPTTSPAPTLAFTATSSPAPTTTGTDTSSPAPTIILAAPTSPAPTIAPTGSTPSPVEQTPPNTPSELPSFSGIPSNEPTPSPTFSTPSPVVTPVPNPGTETPSSIETPTNTPSESPFPTPAGTADQTLEPTETFSPTFLLEPTTANTFIPTSTPIPTPTGTETTATELPTFQPTEQIEATENTLIPTSTPIPTFSGTDTPGLPTTGATELPTFQPTAILERIDNTLIPTSTPIPTSTGTDIPTFVPTPQ